LSRLISYNIYYYGFNEKIFVINNVLAGLRNADTVYNDPLFGMDQINKIFYWVEAYLEGKDSEIF
jgi:hypothetical protein